MLGKLVWVLIGIGLVLFTIGLAVGILALWIIGLLMTLAGIVLVVRGTGVLRKDHVVDRWSVLIAGGQGRGGVIFGSTGNLIIKSNAPNVHVERKEMASGIIRGLLGSKRDFMVITETGNRRLKPFQMFIGARDYGDNLDISWYLTYRPGFWAGILGFFLSIPYINLVFLPFTIGKAFGSMARERRGGLDLDLFDEQDLRAYATNAHHCLMDAVDGLMLELKQDPSAIERKSRGFLGIS